MKSCIHSIQLMCKAGAVQGLRAEKGLPGEAGRVQKAAHDSCGP